VVAKVLEGALASDDGLNKEAEHGEHGEPAVFELLHLQLSRFLRVFSEAKRVEAATGVEILNWVTAYLTKRAASLAEAFNGTHQDDLDDQSGTDRLRVDESGVAKVIEAVRLKDLSASLEPRHVVCLRKGFGHKAADSAEHCPAGVDELSLAIA